MKNKFLIIASSLLLVLATFSCKKSNFLDPKDTTSLDEASVFADSTRTMAFLTGVYEDVGYDFDPKTPSTRGGILSECTDESENRYPTSQGFALQINAAAYSGNFYNHSRDDWSFLYSHIRSANIFIKDVDQSPLSEGLKLRTKAEAKFLRTFYYHYLLKEYGGVPYVGDRIFGLEDGPNVPRDTYADCVDSLVRDLDAAAQNLPRNYIGTLDYGRITKGACMALKSRILLTAASPFFNGGSTAKGNAALEKFTAYPDFSMERWERARKAAEDVMSLNEYSLNVDNTTKPGYGFYKLFLMRVNSEYIFARMLPNNVELEKQYIMPSRGGGFYLHYPLQDFVDLFTMDNGKPTSQDSRYKDLTDAMYQNRDPRFYYTIICNGSTWYDNTLNTQSPVYTYKSTIAANGTETINPTKDGLGVVTSNLSTTTGYYRRKMMDENITPTKGGQTERCYPLIRYAEVLLNYAEAANEVGQTSAAMEIVKQIRSRGGIIKGTDGNYGLPASPSQSDARELIRHERTIELAFEEHRFWDIRRWKIGAKFDNWTTSGMEIIRRPVAGNTTLFTYTYKRVPVRDRKFEDRVYLMPLPVKELSLNTDLLQNPGW